MTRNNGSVDSEPRSTARANRMCSYHHGPAKPRPSTALLNAAREEKNELERVLVRLKLAEPAEREALLDCVDVVDGRVHIQERAKTATAAATMPAATRTPPQLQPSSMMVDEDVSRNGYPTPSGSRTKETAGEEDDMSLSDDDGDDDDGDDDDDDNDDDDTVAAGDTSLDYLSLDKPARPGVYAASATRLPAPPPSLTTTTTSTTAAAAATTTTTEASSPTIQLYRYQLIANAAMSRQHENRLRSLPTIRGVPGELAMHLLDLHWNRQHHTHLLTYRPVLMRELVDGGDYCTDFLVFSVFACASKFSERIELRTDPADPRTMGHRFLRKCEEIIARDAVLGQSRIPTIVGLLMLGATYYARGHTSKGWLYTGYALRMVFDLGLHLDTRDTTNTLATLGPEEVEIRRRVFWGAFICEKMQSVYLGRPVGIQLRDAHVSRDFMDTFEELEPWVPYVDPQLPPTEAAMRAAAAGQWTNTVTYSVSVFQQLCLLAKIMTNIINKIYFADLSARKARKALRQIDEALLRWYRDLPPHLVYEPWTKTQDPNAPAAAATATPAPNLTILHTTYYCFVILLHCPFITSAASSLPNSHAVNHRRRRRSSDNNNNHSSRGSGSGSSNSSRNNTHQSNANHGKDDRNRNIHGTADTLDSTHTTATNAWKRCTTAARNITNLALAYRVTYPLRQSNYMLSYAVYVACTIHVHNAAALFGGGRGSNGTANGTTTNGAATSTANNAANGSGNGGGGGGGATTVPSPESDSVLLLRASLVCLDELAIPNSGAADTARIIRKLMAAKGIPEHLGPGAGHAGGNGVAGTGAGAGAGAGPSLGHGINGMSNGIGGSGDNNDDNSGGGGSSLDAQLLANQEQTTQNAFDNDDFSWQLFNDSPVFDQLAQLQSFSDFGLSGHDLLFGFMEGNFSPSEFMGCPEF
ncbi:Transcription factor [Niveomyces insectorum RCEF 264]|uniref:Transcription factor n=1 Tax=Niveomyces insectorum RCEF 264 TaxID=1081102 RepID=A0A167N340_9HYPO|nr:Transcription factor [Niveomyces insectorum RCEF 264]